MNINVSSLKAKTQEAIAKGQECLAAEAKAAEAKRLAKIAKIKATADFILTEIPAKCEAAAAKGERSVMVMKEKNYSHHKAEFVDKGRGKRWDANITGGHGLIVIDECEKTGLEVDVRYAHDGVGMESWAEIWVSW